MEIKTKFKVGDVCYDSGYIDPRIVTCVRIKSYKDETLVRYEVDNEKRSWEYSVQHLLTRNEKAAQIAENLKKLLTNGKN